MNGLGIAIISTSKGVMTIEKPDPQELGRNFMLCIRNVHMSRIAKQPINIPEKVKFEEDKGHMAVDGPNGKLSLKKIALLKLNSLKIL